MKRGLLGFPLLIFLIQVVSAQFFSGYGSFSLGEFFNRIEPQTAILLLLFLIFFVLIFYPLSKFFKGPYGQPNKAVAGTIAFCVSAIIIYGIYRSGFSLGDLFYNLGVGAGVLYLITSIILIIAAIFLIKKIRFGGFLIVFGLFLILVTFFTEIFYQKLVAILIGFILFVAGILLSIKRKRMLTGDYGDYDSSPQGPRTLSRRREKRRELGDVRHGQRLDYERQKEGDKYQRKLRKEEERQRRKNLAGTRKMRGEGYLKKAERQAYREREIRGRTSTRRTAYKEEAKQRRRQQAQQQIQQINNEIAGLQQMIPSASVIKRGKIEDKIRALEKRARKLR